MGRISKTTTLSTHTTYTINDGTDSTDVKKWIDTKNNEEYGEGNVEAFRFVNIPGN